MAPKFDYRTLTEMKVSPLEEMTKEIQSGDLIFCSGHYPLSSIIKLATASLWSHVGTIFYLNDFSDHFVIESVESIGVRIVPLSRFLNSYREGQPYRGKCVITRTELPKGFSVGKGLKFAASKLGSTYDDWEIANVTWRLIKGHGRVVENDQYNCAELTAAILEKGGRILDQNSRIANTPESLWQSCASEVIGRIR